MLSGAATPSRSSPLRTTCPTAAARPRRAIVSSRSSVITRRDFAVKVLDIKALARRRRLVVEDGRQKHAVPPNDRRGPAAARDLRLPDDVRKRLRGILDRVKPAEHGLIVRTAAEHATEQELRADMTRLVAQWENIEVKAKKANGPALLYREPELAVRVIREEFNAEYRGIVIDDNRLFDEVNDYVSAFNPELADRVEYFDAEEDGLPIFERFRIHEQLHKALDRKVWLPSGGSLIIEHTEALSVIDVNTGKNVGTSNSSLEATVFHNNLEAADEIARQLRLRDIGGIIVIDFIDMEIRENRRKVVDAFRDALSRDKTRTQVFDISDLGLVEMTRKRIGEGLLTSFTDQCPNCEGRGAVVDLALLE